MEEVTRTKSKLIRLKLKQCRKNIGLTRGEVARAANISYKHYIKIENGQNEPSRKTMKNIAEVLMVNKWWELYELYSIEDNREVKEEL